MAISIHRASFVVTIIVLAVVGIIILYQRYFQEEESSSSVVGKNVLNLSERQSKEAEHRKVNATDVFEVLVKLQHKETEPSSSSLTVPSKPTSAKPASHTIQKGSTPLTNYLTLPGFAVNYEEYILHGLIERSVFPPFPPNVPFPSPPYPPEELHITSFLLGHPSVRPNDAAEGETFWRVDEPYRNIWEKATIVMNKTKYYGIGIRGNYDQYYCILTNRVHVEDEKRVVAETSPYKVPVDWVPSASSTDLNTHSRFDIARCRVDHSEEILLFARRSDKQYAVQVQLWREAEKGKAYLLSQYLIPYSTRSTGYMSLPPPHSPLSSLLKQRERVSRSKQVKSARKKNNGRKKSLWDVLLHRAARLPITTVDVWEGLPSGDSAASKIAQSPHPRVYLSTPGWLSPLSIHNVPFLLEFIHHHLNVGVHHIFIGVAFAYASPHFKLMLRVLRKYIEAGVVSLTSQTEDDVDQRFGWGHGAMLHTDSSKIFASNLWLYRSRRGWQSSLGNNTNRPGMGVGWRGEDYLGVWDFDEFFIPINQKTGGKGASIVDTIHSLDPPFLPPRRADVHPHPFCFLQLSSATLFYTPAFLKDPSFTPTADTLIPTHAPPPSPWVEDNFRATPASYTFLAHKKALHPLGRVQFVGLHNAGACMLSYYFQAGVTYSRKGAAKDELAVWDQQSHKQRMFSSLPANFFEIHKGELLPLVPPTAPDMPLNLSIRPFHPLYAHVSSLDWRSVATDNKAQKSNHGHQYGEGFLYHIQFFRRGLGGQRLGKEGIVKRLGKSRYSLYHAEDVAEGLELSHSLTPFTLLYTPSYTSALPELAPVTYVRGHRNVTYMPPRESLKMGSCVSSLPHVSVHPTHKQITISTVSISTSGLYAYALVNVAQTQIGMPSLQCSVDSSSASEVEGANSISKAQNRRTSMSQTPLGLGWVSYACPLPNPALSHTQHILLHIHAENDKDQDVCIRIPAHAKGLGLGYGSASIKASVDGSVGMEGSMGVDKVVNLRRQVVASQSAFIRSNEKASVVNIDDKDDSKAGYANLHVCVSPPLYHAHRHTHTYHPRREELAPLLEFIGIHTHRGGHVYLPIHLPEEGDAYAIHISLLTPWIQLGMVTVWSTYTSDSQTQTDGSREASVFQCLLHLDAHKPNRPKPKYLGIWPYGSMYVPPIHTNVQSTHAQSEQEWKHRYQQEGMEEWWEQEHIILREVFKKAKDDIDTDPSKYKHVDGQVDHLAEAFPSFLQYLQALLSTPKDRPFWVGDVYPYATPLSPSPSTYAHVRKQTTLPEGPIVYHIPQRQQLDIIRIWEDLVRAGRNGDATSLAIHRGEIYHFYTIHTIHTGIDDPSPSMQSPTPELARSILPPSFLRHASYFCKAFGQGLGWLTSAQRGAPIIRQITYMRQLLCAYGHAQGRQVRTQTNVPQPDLMNVYALLHYPLVRAHLSDLDLDMYIDALPMEKDGIVSEFTDATLQLYPWKKMYAQLMENN